MIARVCNVCIYLWVKNSSLKKLNLNPYHTSLSIE